MVVSLLGVALLLAAFLLGWFEVSGRSENMWGSFALVDLVVAASALAAIAAGPAALFREREGLAVTLATVSANIAVVATLLLIWRSISPPGEGTVREVGIWVGLGLQTGILICSFAAMGGGAPPRLSSAR